MDNKLIDLAKVYETYIRIPNFRTEMLIQKEPRVYHACSQRYLNYFRVTVCPLIKKLKERKIIKWYCFLQHKIPDGDDYGVHIRMEVPKGGIRKLRKHLPENCKFIRRCTKKSLLAGIEGVDKELIINDELTYAWWMIGECSSWIINLMKIHWHLTVEQAQQFKHYFDNALGIYPIIPRSKIKRLYWRLVWQGKRIKEKLTGNYL